VIEMKRNRVLALLMTLSGMLSVGGFFYVARAAWSSPHLDGIPFGNAALSLLQWGAASVAIMTGTMLLCMYWSEYEDRQKNNHGMRTRLWDWL
jgi:hypothetical protein